MKKLLFCLSFLFLFSISFAVSHALNILNGTKHSYINVCGYVIKPHHQLSFFYNGIFIYCKGGSERSNQWFGMFVTDENNLTVEDLGVFQHSNSKGIIQWNQPTNWGSRRYLVGVSASHIQVDDYYAK